MTQPPPSVSAAQKPATSSRGEPQQQCICQAAPGFFTVAAAAVAALMLLLPPFPSLTAPAQCSKPPAVHSSAAVPAIALFGDSGDMYMVMDWCRRQGPTFSLCFDKPVWNNWLPILPSDNCSGYQDLLDNLQEPWYLHSGFVSCLPSPASPANSPALVSF